MAVVQVSGVMGLSLAGKKLVAESMYAKGRSFLGAAILLRREQGDEYVVLTLICQGVEIILKALLPHRDYNKFQPKLNKLGHNLEKIAAAVITEFSVRPLNTAVGGELKTLNSLYSQHYLRYGTGYDILVDPATIPSGLVLR